MFKSERFQWSSLKKENFSIPLVDILAAEFLLEKDPDATLSQAVLICFILAAARAGHLFVEISETHTFPTTRDIWNEEQTILDHLLEGAKNLSPFLISNDEIQNRPLVKVGTQFYLHKYFSLKKTCEDEWRRLSDATALHPINEELLLSELKEFSSLTDEQAHAVTIGCKNLSFILTGGPGTGKTYTAGRLLHLLEKIINVKTLQIALAAPTGKAALTLEKSLGNFIETPLKATTLHSLLGCRADGSFSERVNILPYDILLIDEASMIDIELMARLLSSIKTGAKLILMGDPYQLPPVDGAPIFPMLHEKHAAKAELTKCLRAETKELIQLAEAVRLNLPLTESASVQFLNPVLHTLESVLTSFLMHFPRKITRETTPEELLKAFQKFRILTPLKVGPGGAKAVNDWILKHLKTEGLNAIPLMITTNDYRLGLFNGEIGVLLTTSSTLPAFFSQNDYVYFSSGKKLPALLLPSYELAYAMTVHKSQGSEFEEVLLLLPETKIALSIPLLYTAVTRARKKITLWGGYQSSRS